jgi:DNA-binding response OmpR family regulator
MIRLAFDTTDTLVYDPVSANRTATRSALFSLGFRRVETVATVDSFCTHVRNQPPDLAICEAQGAEDELCDVVQALRQGSLGDNPFIVIIVTAWEKSAPLVQRIVNSGADDLILRPYSTAQLGQRIEAHTERRKGFVITTEYVGPDRRKDPSRPSNVELFNPPNSLKMKARDRLNPEQVALRLDNELRDARDHLLIEKLRRDSFQICVLWRLMQNVPPGSVYPVEELTKIVELARSIAKRCAEGEYARAAEWSESICSAVEGLQFGVDRQASMYLLGQAALNIHQVLNPTQAPAQHMAELDATIALIEARNSAKLAG